MQQDIRIEFTVEALKKAQELKRDFKRYQGLHLRIYIEGKGCDGFSYGVTFDNPNSEDIRFFKGDLPCLIDPQSYLFCKGSQIDWVEDDRGTGFLVENPNEKKYRGKFFKKSVWQKLLEEKAHI